MKKIFVFIFLFILNISFSYAEDLRLSTAEPDTFIGTYKITFFYTKAPLSTFTTDKDICTKYSYGNKVECSHNKVDLLYGKAQITKDSNGRYIVENKLHISNRLIDKTNMDDTYQYTKYSPAKISSKGLNIDHKAKGYTGRNMTSSIDNDKVDFRYILENNKLIGIINIAEKEAIVLGKPMKMENIPVVVHLEKISNNTSHNFIKYDVDKTLASRKIK